MIDAKRLDEIEEALEKTNVTLWGACSVDEEPELVRLARLGLWAREHGVEAVRLYAVMSDWGYDHEPLGDCDYGETAREALAKLPEGV